MIVKPDSSDTYTIDTQKPLKGVYNINKGYAIFKKVSILCESDEYYIVQEGDSYGLSNYDHIVPVFYTHLLLGEEVPISDFNHKPGLRSKLSSLFHKN